MLDKVRPLALELASGQGHPCEQELERLMHSELTRQEAREIVRHLLVGCPRCLQVTRRLWTDSGRKAPDLEALKLERRKNFTLLKSIRRERTMTEAEAQAQAELREVVAELDALAARLESVHDRLPVTAQETAMLLGEVEMDVATEVRSVIECVVHDDLRPAIRELQAAAGYLPQER